MAPAMITALLMLMAGTTPSPTPATSTYENCTRAIGTDADHGIARAEAWRAAGGGMAARQCLGLAYVAAERWGPAALAFEQAAKAAEIERDGRAANLWVQSGNASLAGDDAAKARIAFDRALALPVLSDPMRGETLLDRGRAGVAANDPGGARADLDAALKLVPKDPMAWLLSATLARRQSDLARAAKDIAEAVRMAPDAAAIAYEQGNIAFETGDSTGAKGNWQRAIELDKSGDIAASARLAIAKAETGATNDR